jgi:hypothetical protein
MCLVAASTSLGCGGSYSKAEMAKVQAELATARSQLKTAEEEIAALKARPKPVEAPAAAAPAKAMSDLEELERLDALRTKGVLTAEEFETRKKAVLYPAPKPIAPAKVGFTVQELADQFRTLQGLYNLSTINAEERDQKMQRLIDGPLAAGDLKTDLETVQGLYNLSVITAPARDALKKKILERDSNTP